MDAYNDPGIRRERPNYERSWEAIPFPEISPMNHEAPEYIRILQQNVNASNVAQAEIMNTHHNSDIDIIAFQEPYFDFKGTTRASREWISVYPTGKEKEGAPKTRSMMLISSRIKSETWEEIHTKSNDITIIRIRTKGGWLYICNIYNDCNNDDAINELARICHEKENENSDFIWLGDFNRHHPMWDNPAHKRLFTAENIRKAEKLINFMMSLGLTMILEKETPTLEHMRSKSLS